MAEFNNNITFTNTSLSTLETVAEVALPVTFELPKYPCVKVNNAYCPLIPLKSVGDITNIFTVKGRFPAGITECEIFSHPEKTQPFQWSEHLLKNPVGNILKAIVTLSNGETLTLFAGGPLNVVAANDHIVRFDIESPVTKGFKLKQILSAFTGLDHIRFALGLNWHDRETAETAISISQIVLECNSEFRIHYANQMQLPNPTYIAPIDTWRLTLTSSYINRDGQGFELRGYILSMPENLQTEPYPDFKIENMNAVRNGHTRYGGVGEVNGVFNNLNHSNNWFNKHLPNLSFPYPGLRQQLMLNPGIFGLRSVGSLKVPGNTGAQQDFGSDKGFEATVFHDAAYITMMRAGQVDRLRFFNIHEPDGSKVTKENHPGWATWNMETFNVLATDTLGKNKNWRPDGTGWMGYDNQHRSQNNVLTYYALTGDELTLDTLINCLEADIAQSPYGQADREVGRMFTCWAKMLRVLPASYLPKLRAHIKTKIDHLSNNWRGRFPEIQGDQSKTVRVNQVIIDPRSNIRNPANGRYEPCWIAYQTAQMAQGIYTLSLVYNDPRLPAILKDICYSFLWHGCFEQDGTWYTALFVRYLTGLESGQQVGPNAAPEEGRPLPSSSYNLSNWEISIDTQSPQGWWNWVGPCLAIGYKILDEDSKVRIRSIFAQTHPNGFGNIDSAEWFACELPSVHGDLDDHTVVLS